MRSPILWLHVLCGAIWVASCAVFVLAGSVLGQSPEEFDEFIQRVARPLNCLGLTFAALIPLTGLGNLFFLLRSVRSRVTDEFLGILGAKVLLITLMVWLQWQALNLAARSRDRGEKPEEVIRGRPLLIRTYAGIAISGAVALGLGLWLSGVR